MLCCFFTGRFLKDKVMYLHNSHGELVVKSFQLVIYKSLIKYTMTALLIAFYFTTLCHEHFVSAVSGPKKRVFVLLSQI